MDHDTLAFSQNCLAIWPRNVLERVTTWFRRFRGGAHVFLTQSGYKIRIEYVLSPDKYARDTFFILIMVLTTRASELKWEDVKADEI